MERTTCLGTCPAYTLQITSAGDVDYEGKQFVRVTGHVHASVPADQVAELVAEFDRIGYFSLDDAYKVIVHPDGSRTSVTDLATTNTSIRLGSRRKAVEDYVGAPAALRNLERRIDAVAGTIRWISVTPEVVLELQQRGWRADGDEGATYLSSAVSRGDITTVNALLQAGADPNDRVISAMFVATDPAILEALIAVGGNVNARALGEPLLTWAVRAGRADKVVVLLHAGALIDATNEQGKTALAVAIESAAAPIRRPFPGETQAPPHEFARIATLLRTAGAKAK